MAIEFSLKGQKELRARILGLALTARSSEAMAAITAEMEIEFAASQEMVPVKTGRLKRSGRVIPTVMSGAGEQVDFVTRIIYDAPYAYKQHMALHYRHDDGQANYLGSVLRESRRFMGERIARRLRTIMAAP